MSRTISRRTALTLGSAAAASMALPMPFSAAALSQLTLYGPPAGPSIVLAHAVASGMLADSVKAPAFKAWRNPDELRAGLTSKNIQVTVMPVQAATNLYNRGFPLKLVNVMTKGLLYVVSADPTISSVESLDGKTVAVPFRGDTPDIIFDRLLAGAGFDKNGAVKKVSVATPVEAVQMLLTDRVAAALMPEPAVSAAILRGKKAGKTITRAIDIQEAWGKLTGGAPILPQAGLAVTGPFLAEHAALVDQLQAELVKAAAATNANPKVAAADATGPLKLPAPVIAASIPHSNLGAWPASEMQQPIERMLSVMAEIDMKKIGGKLPDSGLFL